MPGGAGSSACPEALCELNVKCTAHYIYVAVTLCDDSLSVWGRALSFQDPESWFSLASISKCREPPCHQISRIGPPQSSDEVETMYGK